MFATSGRLRLIVCLDLLPDLMGFAWVLVSDAWKKGKTLIKA